jgi:hypothetical protein
MTALAFDCGVLWLDELPVRVGATFGMRVGFTSDVRPTYIGEVERKESEVIELLFAFASLRTPF